MNKRGRYGQFIRVIFSAVDFAVLNLAYLLIYLINGPCDFFSRHEWLLMNLSLLLTEFITSNIHQRRVVFADRVIIEAFRAVIIHMGLFYVMVSFLDITPDAGNFFAFYALLYIGISLWWIISRKMIKRYRTLGFNFRRIIIIGGGAPGTRLLDEMLGDAGYGYRVLGIFDDNKKNRNIKNYAGTLDQVEKFVKDNFIDEMYCTIPDEAVAAQMIKVAESNAVDFYYVPTMGKHIARKVELNSIGNVAVLSLRPNPLNNPFNRWIKRAFDFLVSSILLIISPVVIIPIATAIKISSPGPIFFRQKRTGYRGKEFWCYKFRTMRVNPQSDQLQASENDPRKTRLGDFLRRTSIDELPQFFNVWRGDMSIVGPRPHMIKHTQDYSALIDKYMIRHTIKPGITGWAQVNGYRGETKHLWQMEKRVEFDMWYAENWNLMLDFKIIFLTVVNALRGESNAF